MAHAPGYEFSYPPPPPPAVPHRAPVGILAVAVLNYLTGMALLLAAGAIGVVRYGGGAVAGTELPQSVREALTGAGLPIATLCAFGGLLALLVGRRLQRGRQWSRLLVIVLSVLSLAWTGYSMVSGRTVDPLSGLVLPILYLVLLNTPPARDWFRYRGYH